MNKFLIFIIVEIVIGILAFFFLRAARKEAEKVKLNTKKIKKEWWNK